MFSDFSKKTHKIVWTFHDNSDVLGEAFFKTLVHGKRKLVDNQKLKLVANDGVIVMHGEFDKKHHKIVGTLEGFDFKHGHDKALVATGYDLHIRDLFPAIKDAAAGDTDSLSAYLFGKSLILKGSPSGDQFDASPGNDKLIGNGGDDGLYGADGNDRLFGGTGNDNLLGGRGDDRLDGGDGDDTLDGGDGNNVATGGAGNDTFQFSSLTGNTEITDFGAGDRVALRPDAFPDLGSPGPISPGLIEFGVDHASNADIRLFVDTSGRLIHDPNGSAAGGETVLAVFSGGIPNSADQFLVV